MPLSAIGTLWGSFRKTGPQAPIQSMQIFFVAPNPREQILSTTELRALIVQSGPSLEARAGFLNFWRAGVTGGS